MIRAAAIVLLCCGAGPALALSCLAPSVERSFARFDASEDTYVVVHGRLTLDETALPKGMTVDRDPPPLTVVRAKLQGFSLTRQGFTLPFEQAVSLEVSCLGPWCGSAKNGEDALAFLRKDAEGYVLAVEPCGGALFETPKLEQLDQAKKCLRTGACKTG